MIEKIQIPASRNPLLMPVVIISTRSAEGVLDFATVAWITKVNSTPPLVAFSMGIHKKTVKNILETHTFGINIPNRHLIGQVEYCGLNSGNTLLKDHVFTTSVGGKTGAPLVQECPISIECTLQQTVELPKNILIIAQIENILCDSAAMMDGKVDLQKIDPVLHSMLGDYIYCAIGDKTGDAYVKNA